MLGGIGHLDLVCRVLVRSLRFYEAVFGPLGLQSPVTFPRERGELIHYLRFPHSRVGLARVAAGGRGAGIRADVQD